MPIRLGECLTIPPDKIDFKFSKAMKLYKTIIHSAIISTSIVAASLPVHAAVITYTDRDAFLAALSSSSTDNYNDLTSGTYISPLSRTIPGYTYNAVGGFFFNTDAPFNLLNRVITVTANPGASTQSVVTGSATNFFG